MKPRDLFIEAAKELEPMQAPPEQMRLEEARHALQNRTDFLLQRTELYSELHKVIGFDYDRSYRLISSADGDPIRITTRAVNLSAEAGTEFDNLLGGDVRVWKSVVISVHDREYLQPDNSWWKPPETCGSIDVITELFIEASPDDLLDFDDSIDTENPFVDFQVLERMNWSYPVFEQHGGDNPFNASLSSSAELNAKIRSSQNYEGELQGIHAALDDLEAFLNSQGA